MNKTFCPVANGWLCPYWDKEGVCLLENSLYACDDYYALMGDYEEEDEEE